MTAKQAAEKLALHFPLAIAQRNEISSDAKTTTSAIQLYPRYNTWQSMEAKLLTLVAQIM